MITSITLENFKCFRKLEVQPRLITVFVGPNGSGKSSVLQALALLKQSVGRGELLVRGDLINLRFHEQLHPHFAAGAEKLHLGFGGTQQLTPPAADHFGSSVTFSYDVELIGGGVAAHWGKVSCTYGGRPHKFEIDREGKTNGDLATREGKVALQRGSAIANPISFSLSTSNPIPPQLLQLQDSLLGVLAAPNRELASLRLVPGVRGLVRSEYMLGSQLIDDISLTSGLSYQEQQTATNLAYTRALEGKLSAWLKRITGVGLRADMTPPQSVEVNALAPAGAVNMVMEGFGSNALILLLWQLASATNGATVMIEEPEIHLHPRAQAELASLLAEVAKAENKQIIMTTHSEHILGRLLTLVAEKKLTTDELAIYAFEKDEQGVCTANQLEVTEDGRVKGDIKDFFEPELAELDRYIRALQAQK